jgi:hypothetical protein
MSRGMGETAKFLPLCKAVFVENQLDFTKEPLEVVGDGDPRYMIALDRIRLTSVAK